MTIGCTVPPQWPDPEITAAKLTNENALMMMDATELPHPAPFLAHEEHLSLKDAMRMALTASPDIHAALARVRQAYAQAYQERLLPNPIVIVTFKFPTGGGTPSIESSIAADLLSLLQRRGKIEAADHRLRAASAEAVTVVLDVLQQVQSCYARIQSLEAITQVLENRRRLLDQLWNIAHARLKYGEGTRLDVTTLETQRMELETEIREHHLERREARLELARIIGRPADAIEWRLDEWNEPKEEHREELAWIQAGLEHRPEIAAKLWELKAIGVDFQQVRWDILTGAEVGLTAEGPLETGAEDQTIGTSLMVPLPIVDWGQARRDMIAARQLEITHQLTATRRQVVEEIRRAYMSYRTAVEGCKFIRDTLIPALEVRRRQAESQYLAGQIDIVPLILADQDLLTSRTKLIEFQRRATISFTQLQRAVGGPGLSVPSATQPASRPTASSTN